MLETTVDALRRERRSGWRVRAASVALLFAAGAAMAWYDDRRAAWLRACDADTLEGVRRQLGRPDHVFRDGERTCVSYSALAMSCTWCAGLDGRIVRNDGFTWRCVVW